MAEKPLECTQCSLKVCVTYKEIGKSNRSSMGMCSNCPILEKKLRGEPEMSCNQESRSELYCVHCLTTLKSLQMGEGFGCTHCYVVFDRPLTEKLIQEKRIPCFDAKELSNSSLHLGKSPDRSHSIPPTHQMASLQEALQEALKKEQYEEAAWIRDQIQEWEGKIGESS